MFRFLIAILWSGAALAQPADADKVARIEGRIVDQEGQPVRRGAVRLVGPATLQETADADGRFVVDKIPPGMYALIGFGKGFAAQKYGAKAPLVEACPYAESITSSMRVVTMPTNQQRCIAGSPGTMFTLEAGKATTELVFKLTRQATLAGRVTNQEGEPVPKWSVSLLQWVRSDGKRQLQNRATVQTDADGNFAFGGIAPGRYYAQATDLTGTLFSDMGSERRGKTPPEIDLPTYYPGEAEPQQAKAIEVGAGAELRSIDIQVRHGRTYSIRGTVAAPPDSGVADQILTLAQKNAPAVYAMGKSARVRADGSFEFRRVEAGDYTILGGTAFANPGSAPPMFTRQEVTVANADVEGLKLAMTPEAEMRGTMTLEGGNTTSWPGIYLRDTKGNRNAMASERGKDGAFQFRTRIAPSTYIVEMLNMPPGMYVKSIRFGKEDLLQEALDLTEGAGGSLDIVLSAKVARVTGTVKNGNEEGLAGLVVSLWPKVARAASGVRSISSDQNGNFEIADLGPGEYLVAAWESVEPGVTEDAGFLARFENDAIAIRVEEGGHANAAVKVVPRERIAAEAAKLR